MSGATPITTRPQTSWPEWFKNMVATATIGVPVVLWLFVAAADAREAKTLAVENRGRLRDVEEKIVRAEERYAHILKSQGEIKARLSVAPSDVLAAVKELRLQVEKIKRER